MADAFTKARKRQLARLGGAKPPAPRAAIALAKSRAYQDAADAPATLRAYAADLANYRAWCDRHAFVTMPATPEVVGAYLAAAGEGYAMPTLRRRVAAIARACGVAGHPLDTKHPAIRETLRGIGRKHGSPARRAAAITTAEVRKLCRACGPDLAGARDQAMFLLGFAGALRRSELVGLDMEHVIWTGNGLRLLIERSKTDAQGDGAEIAIPHGQADHTCPVTALKTWLELSEITAGPLFRKVNRGGVVERARLTTDAVRQILFKRAAKAGLKGTLAEPFSPHGLRAGFVTTAYRNGVPDEEIMGHTRHRSLTTMRGYVRRAKLSRESPAGKLGLWNDAQPQRTGGYVTLNGMSREVTIPPSRTLAVATRDGIVVPRVIAAAGDQAARRFLEFFAATIRNKNTRMAYYRAACDFFAWCDRHRIGGIADIEPLHVAAYIENLQHAMSKPTVKQHLAAIRMLFDWLVTGQVVATNPAHSVRGPKHVVKTGKTTVLDAEQARKLLDSIDTSTVVGLRDRALISVMTFAFARIGAVVAMRVEDYYPQGKGWWVRLHEKGGKRHEMPAHHTLEAYLDTYIEAAGIRDGGKTPLFRSAAGRTGTLTEKPMNRVDAWRMVQRRAADLGTRVKIGCHTFRATGITAYLEAGGTLENAQLMAAHESPRTTKLYDRTGDEITLDEVERITI